MPAIIDINANRPEPLVKQIVDGLTCHIGNGLWPAGSRAPSIREFAKAHDVSTFTVVEAYERLVAQGLLKARRGAGFYVTGPVASTETGKPAPEQLTERAIDSGWLLRKVFEHTEGNLHAGCGWLPANWHHEEGIGKGLRQLALRPQEVVPYGQPKGYEPLRQLVSRQLAELEIDAPPTQILLTSGAIQGLDLVARRFTQPGDTVLVDDPGYSDLLFALRLRGLKLVGVPMTPNGPDIAALENILSEHQPRLYFTNTQLQNPTGASYSTATAFQVLRLAEKHQFRIVEDNVSADLVTGRALTLAAADQLQRVIYIGSFSKTIAPGLRVGFVAAEPALLDELVYYKLACGMATPELNEQLVHAIYQEGVVRKHLEQLRGRLARAQERTGQRLENAGFTLFHQPGAGMFVWARPPENTLSALALSQQAVSHHILLAPGHLFRPNQEDSPWLRFNVAYSNNDKLFAFLARALSQPAA